MPHTPDKGHDKWEKAEDARKQNYKEQKASKSLASNNATKSKKKPLCNSEIRASLCITFLTEPKDFDENNSASKHFK